MTFRYLDKDGALSFWTNIKNYILSKIPTKTSELTNDSGFLTSHQSLSNYVTLNTAQEITNAKTFKDANTVVKRTDIEAGNTLPSADKLARNIFQDKNGKELGSIFYYKNTSGNTGLCLRAGDWFSESEGVYSLNASGTNRRAELHLYSDSSGNCCIKPVGLFSAHLKPLNSSICLAEYGKPFGMAYVNQVRFTNATLQVDVDIDATEEHSIGFFGKNNGPLSYITFQKRPSFKDRVAIRIQTSSSAYKSYDFDATCFYPESNNSVDIGSTTNIFKNIYCNNYYKGTTAFGDIVTHNASEFLTSHQSLANYALDANVVHTSGNETVGGQKTFTNDIVVSKNASNMAIFLQNLSYDPKTNGQSGIEGKSCGINFLTSTGDPYININAYGLGDRTLLRFTNSYFTDSQNIDYDSVEFSIYGNGARSFRPKNTSNCDLGESNKQWKGVYATNYYYGVNNVEFSTKFVTTDTNQTVTGQKVFISTPYIYNYDSTANTPNIFLRNSKVTKGGSDAGNQGIFFADKDNKTLSRLFTDNSSNGTTSLNLKTSTLDSNNNDVSAEVYLSVGKTGTKVLQSSVNNDISLGTSGNRWKSVYATNYYYGSNNVEFSTKFVTTDTNQTISGTKIFSATFYIYNDDSTGNTPNLYFKSSKAIKGDSSGSNNDSTRISHIDKNDKLLSYIQLRKVSNGSSDITFYCSTTDTNNQDISSSVTFFKAVNGQGTFRSVVDNDVNLGNSTYKWKDVNTYLINALEPSSLSLPSGNVNDFIDISSYFSNTGSGDTNSYTALANGWIYLRLGDITSCQVVLNDSSNRRLWGTSATGNVEQIIIPILKNTTLTTTWVTNSTVNVATARFIPCQGNV